MVYIYIYTIIALIYNEKLLFVIKLYINYCLCFLLARAQ